MKCRHCGMELEDGTTVCPNCQKNTASPKTWHLILSGVLGFAVAFALCLVIMKDQGVNMGWLDPATWFQKKPAAVQQGEKEPYDYDLNRDSYTSSDASKASVVVATIGDLQLTNAELNGYYWTGVYNFLSQYSSYLSYFGLDLTKPFDQQLYPDSDETWQQSFLKNALTEWHKYSALYLQGQKEGYRMSEEMQTQLENMKTTINANWKENGFSSLEEMIHAEMSPLCTEEGYWHYMEVYHYAMDYFEYKYLDLEPTDEEVAAYFDANASKFNFTKDSKKHNVRHILIEPKGGVADEYGMKTYTDAEWEACRKEAQAILDSWDGTEDGFAKLAAEYTMDTGSAQTGGLYEDLTDSTNFVEEFKNWYLDPVRKTGDTGLITSVYGYHIMYYSSGTPIWEDETKKLLWNENSETYIQGLMAAFPFTLVDENIAIGDLKLQ